MKFKSYLFVCLAPALAACAAPQAEAPQPSHPIEGVRKAIDSISAEVAKRQAADPFRGLPVVVAPTRAGGGTTESIMAELLRTRLVDRGIPVDTTCAARCMEVSLQELSIDTPKAAGPGGLNLTPGQVLTVAGGNIPVVGGLVRSIGEQEKEKERAANRASGLFVTFSARDGNRYTARINVVAIISAGNIALEQQ
jgi:hypothetical protein